MHELWCVMTVDDLAIPSYLFFFSLIRSRHYQSFPILEMIHLNASKVATPHLILCLFTISTTNYLTSSKHVYLYCGRRKLKCRRCIFHIICKYLFTLISNYSRIIVSKRYNYHYEYHIFWISYVWMIRMNDLLMQIFSDRSILTGFKYETVNAILSLFQCWNS